MSDSSSINTGQRSVLSPQQKVTSPNAATSTTSGLVGAPSATSTAAMTASFKTKYHNAKAMPGVGSVKDIKHKIFGTL